MLIIPTLRKIEEIDKKEVGRTYCEVFKDAPWFEEWKLEDAISEVNKARSREGYVGVLCECGNKIIAFSWGYKLPRENFDGKNFLEMRDLLKKLSIDSETTFYGCETGVISDYRGKGIGTKTLAYRTNLLDKDIKSLIFRTKNEAMVSVYRKIFGSDSVKEIASDPVFPDRKLYLVRIGGRASSTSFQSKTYLKGNKEEKSVKLERAKGTRDFLPKEKIIRDYIQDTIKSVFELYGFDPLETPILERYEVLASKYAGGSEILKETFKLKDQGSRILGLRYDLTVPLARFIGMNPNLKMPFKRYQIERVFRDGPVEKGRVREFYQCDADIVGSSSILADAEIINLSFNVFKKLNFKVKIRLNNRKILNSILDYADIKKDRDSVILSIDKFYKIGKTGVIKELKDKNLSKEQIDKIMKIILLKGLNKEKISKLKKVLKNQEGILEIEQILSYVDNPNLIFDISLARGLAYYTGPIFEVVLQNNEICSVGGGGRYDNMISDLLESKQNYPATGISFGLDRIYDALINEKREFEESKVKIYVIPIKTLNESLKILQKIRSYNINSDIDLLDRGISKNLEYANSKKIPYVIIIGQEELKQNKIKLKEMKTGKEKLIKVEEIKKLI